MIRQRKLSQRTHEIHQTRCNSVYIISGIEECSIALYVVAASSVTSILGKTSIDHRRGGVMRCILEYHRKQEIRRQSQRLPRRVALPQRLRSDILRNHLRSDNQRPTLQVSNPQGGDFQRHSRIA